jgi:hypothetical protein
MERMIRVYYRNIDYQYKSLILSSHQALDRLATRWMVEEDTRLHISMLGKSLEMETVFDTEIYLKFGCDTKRTNVLWCRRRESLEKGSHMILDRGR